MRNFNKLERSLVEAEVINSKDAENPDNPGAYAIVEKYGEDKVISVAIEMLSHFIQGGQHKLADISDSDRTSVLMGNTPITYMSAFKYCIGMYNTVIDQLDDDGPVPSSNSFEGFDVLQVYRACLNVLSARLVKMI